MGHGLITNPMINISQKLKDKLWWLVISVDYDYSRITIDDHNLTEDTLTFWLEDKQDFKNTLDECLQVDIPTKQFSKFISDQGFNSYEGAKLHPTKNYAYKTRIEISAPLNWYRNDATLTEQLWAREAVLKHMLTELIESQTISEEMFF